MCGFLHRRTPPASVSAVEFIFLGADRHAGKCFRDERANCALDIYRADGDRRRDGFRESQKQSIAHRFGRVRRDSQPLRPRYSAIPTSRMGVDFPVGLFWDEIGEVKKDDAERDDGNPDDPRPGPAVSTALERPQLRELAEG